jgi:hypothetical protein
MACAHAEQWLWSCTRQLAGVAGWSDAHFPHLLPPLLLVRLLLVMMKMVGIAAQPFQYWVRVRHDAVTGAQHNGDASECGHKRAGVQQAAVW